MSDAYDELAEDAQKNDDEQNPDRKAWKSAFGDSPMGHSEDRGEATREMARAGDPDAAEKLAKQELGVTEADEQMADYIASFKETYPEATAADAYQAALLERIAESVERLAAPEKANPLEVFGR